MLSGFNTNFRYRGVLFHVQTEDSGRENPHVITHLFHGGNIIASQKQDYSDRLEDGDIEEVVRKLMEGQHKAMLKQLSRGEHDAVIGERLGPDVFLAEAPGEAERQAPSAAEEEAFRDETPQSTERAEEAAGASEAPPGPTPAPSRLAGVFGDRVVSEKPLDEVVLDYLVENARKRKRSGQ